MAWRHRHLLELVSPGSESEGMAAGLSEAPYREFYEPSPSDKKTALHLALSQPLL